LQNMHLASSYKFSNSTDCISNQEPSNTSNGGHYGHFAQVTFKWNYPAQSAPSLIILHEGRVVYCSKMTQAQSGSGAGLNCAVDPVGRASNICIDDVQDDDVYEVAVVMRAGEEYDYFFEVDGERRYDFDCDFGSVEVCQTTTTTTTTTGTTTPTNAGAAALAVGTIIIANSIQIEEKAESALSHSTCSSSSSSDGNCNNNDYSNDCCDDWQLSGPSVNWHASVEQLVKQVKPKKDVMIIAKPAAAAANAVFMMPAFKGDVVTPSSEPSSLASSYRYYGMDYYQPEVVAVKRVHFWDAAVVHQQRRQQQVQQQLQQAF